MAESTEFSVLLNEIVLPGPDTTQPEPMEEEFEPLTDAFTLDTLTGAIMEINGLIIEEQWKRTGGDGSEWEQAPVQHRAELREGVTQIKARMNLNDKKEAMVVDVKEIPAIIVQEPESEDDRKVSGVFEDNEGVEIVDLTSVQSPSKFSQLPDLPEVNEDFIIAGFLSEEEANAILESLETEPQDQPRPQDSLDMKLDEDDADFERKVSTSDGILVGDHDVLLKSSEEPLSTFLENIAKNSPVKRLSAHAAAQFPPQSVTSMTRGSKRGSREAELDEKDASLQVDIPSKKKTAPQAPLKSVKKRETEQRLTLPSIFRFQKLL